MRELAEGARFSRFSGGPKRACSRKFNFSKFKKTERAAELLIVIFENSSPKGSFRSNKMKAEISYLSWKMGHSRGLQTVSK